MPIFYVLITNYANRVYTILPANRGGKLSLTQAHITFKDANVAKELWNSIEYETEIGRRFSAVNKSSNNHITIYPLYIVEQNDTCLYVATDYPAFIGYSIFENFKFPKIHKINMADIAIIDYEQFDVRAYYLTEINKKGKKKEGEKDPQDFCDNDFKPQYIEKLCAKIDSDTFVLDLSNKGYTIDRLNEILTISNFYAALLSEKKSNISFSSNIKELLERTEKYRTTEKYCTKLPDSEKRNIKELNRRLLEEIYPQLIP